MAGESEIQTPKWALPAFLGAAALLIVALGYAAMRDRSPAPEPINMSAGADAPTLEELQAATRAKPDDPEAWARLATAYYEREQYADGVTALERATTLAPDRSNLWSLLGEMRIYADGRDPMPAAAVTAFEKALALDPKDPSARYFMAVRKDLAKDHKGAIDDWLALLADTPPGAPWEADLRRTIEQVGQRENIPVATRIAAIRQPAPVSAPPHATAAPTLPTQSGIPGPNAEQVREASKLSPTDQDAMARGMVGNLENRLRGDPKNVGGWVMLMRSRMTLNEPDKAAKAYRDAVAANPEAKATLQGEARTLRVPGV
ncbi:tetratricopeptide repeat protein [Sphingomonas sp. AOB5]|uniref:tetratricopeptide repeat protein n=1 Tax=Sphingomonas sp. AOB5 TaxID=3034017 RepID=UPI0023F77E47|nr:tetratricopeptide repeat protein [Sphingomonas sp. AOB5]MDF7776422.1 tetratricopeptide repeat protein [Sphingomonas sp. AOB5]